MQSWKGSIPHPFYDHNLNYEGLAKEWHNIVRLMTGFFRVSRFPQQYISE